MLPRTAKKIAVANLVFILIMSCPMLALASNFRDVSDEFWGKDSIHALVQVGVLQGYDDQTFRPDNSVTRAELAAILTRAAGLETGAGQDAIYTDVAQGDWYSGHVSAVTPYLAGYKANGGMYFKPDQAATREEMTAAIVKLLGYEAETGSETQNLQRFSDSNDISVGAKPYISQAVGQGIIEGYPDSTFRPNGNVTRAEAATILWKVYSLVQDVDRQTAGAGNELDRFEGRWRNIDMNELEFLIAFSDQRYGAISYTSEGESFSGAFEYEVTSPAQVKLTLLDDPDGTPIVLTHEGDAAINIEYGGYVYRMTRNP